MKRAQAAMEFIMTYGWAILVLLAAIGALAYFGVLSPQKFLPEKCDITSGFTCDDYMLAITGQGGEVEIQIRNALGKTIVLSESANVTYKGVSGDSNFCGTWHDVAAQQEVNGLQTWTLNPGKAVFMICNTGSGSSIRFPTAGEKERVDFEFTYNYEGKVFNHKATGSVFATVQP